MTRWVNVQDITWFLDLQVRQQLELDPPYQRKSVWALKDRQYFLDTIFRNYPCPAIFLHKNTNDVGKTTYYVVDGKQRLETIIMFSNNEISIGKKYGSTDFDGKKFNELTMTGKSKFWDYKIPVDFIDPSDTINEIFYRLNRVSKNLKPQELRHARYDGWFITEAEDEAANLFWTDMKISTKARSKRMQDVQFVSELLVILIEKKISGFDQYHITEIYATYDDIFDTEHAFEKSSYLAEKEQVKRYILKMAENNEGIVKWTKSFTNFYTLWALVALFGDKLPDSKKLASKYKIFMEKVDSITEEIEPQNLPNQDRCVYTYHSNSHGASADIKKRNARLDSLKTAILDDEDNRIN